MIKRKAAPKQLVGQSPQMQKVNHLIEKAAQSDFDCLLLGETGTGKELVARAIHEKSERKDGPFVAVNCSALSESLLESELFGHVKGAFTGAIGDKKGKFELAQGGTLFLDEIGEMPQHIQIKLLRVLQEREVERVGDNRLRPINVRLITATNANLPKLVSEDKYRSDFYYRINVFSLTLPSLKERSSDISELADYFLKIHSTQSVKISQEALNVLQKHDWPGNIRQLENAIKYALVLCSNGIIQADDLPDDILSLPKNNAQLSEKEELQMVLEKANGNRTEAAKLLGISRITVWKRMKKYGFIPEKVQKTDKIQENDGGKIIHLNFNHSA